jgi:hydrogenase maturation factor/predicted fused transcriptional regulator/phosphomethylpyrimidine kinase
MSPEDFGWLTVHIGASDVAVMGIIPRYMTYSLLLPPDTGEEYIERLTRSIDKYARELGIAIVGGHTGFYGAVTVPTIGGITVWGTGKDYITPAGAKNGDAIIITKGAAIEAAALLACELGDRIMDQGISKELVERAGKRLKEVTVVEDARLAAAVAGVHAMHDATEGGVCRGLWEIAQASDVGMKIERSRVLLPQDIKVVCECFNLNPYEVISEGTLVLTCDSNSIETLLDTFKEAGIDAAVIGEVIPAREGCYWVESNGEKTSLIPPEGDRFWDVFFNALGFKDDAISEAEKALCRELKEAVTWLEEAAVSNLIPEIGANLAYAPLDAKELGDIAAIPGRLLRFKGKVIALGEPEMGCSSYMGGTLLAVREHFPEARCVINLYNNEKIRSACKKLNYRVAHMPVPADYRQSDTDYYRDLNLVLSDCESLPDIIEIPDRINLERLILVLGKNLGELVSRVITLSNKVEEMK